MLCATKPDVAAKHHGIVAYARFDRSSIALQHAPATSKPESPLVFHYTLSLFCCRYGTVRRRATEPLIRPHVLKFMSTAKSVKSIALLAAQN
jgi:hypothetical protein